MIDFSNRLTLASIWCIVLFSFVSLSASALSHILIFIPIFISIYLLLKNGQKVKFSKSMIFLGVMVFFCVLSVILAPDIENKFKQASKVKYFLLGLLAVFPYRNLFKIFKREQAKKMLNVFLVLVAIGNIAGIHALFDGFHYLRWKGASDGSRAAGMYGMAITYGYGIEYIVILLTSLAVNFWDKLNQLANKKLFIFSTITCYLGMYLSYTRGALLAFIVSIPFLFILTKKKLFKITMAAGVVLVIALTAIVFSISNGNKSFGNNRFLLSAQNKSNLIRISIYETVWEAFKEKPFTGWGFRNFEKNSFEIKRRHDIEYADFGGHAHNNYLEILAGSGIFAFLSLLAFLGCWWREVWTRADDFSIILIPFLVSFLFSGLFQNTITDGENMFVIMFIYTVSQGISKKQKVFV